MSAPWADFSDVDNRYYGSTLNPDQAVAIEYLIAQAQRQLRAKVPSIQRRLDDGTLDPEAVRDAIAAMVLRVVRNPDGLQSETEGNYLYSVMRDVAGGKLFPTGDDLALLRPVVTTTIGKPIQVTVPCWRSRP